MYINKNAFAFASVSLYRAGEEREGLECQHHNIRTGTISVAFTDTSPEPRTLPETHLKEGRKGRREGRRGEVLN